MTKSFKQKKNVKKQKWKTEKSLREFKKDNIDNVSDNVVVYSGMRIPRALAPPKSKVVLKYADFFTLDVGVAGVIAIRNFRANGMYDPDATGAGHQPRGFDQWMAMYDHFVVIGGTCKVIFAINTEDAGSGAALGGISLRDTSGLLTDSRDYVEIGSTVYGCLPMDTSSQLVLQMDYNPNEFLGRSKPLSDPDLKGSSTGDPTEQAYLQVWVDDIANASNLTAINCFIEITYNAMLIEPRDPGAS